MPFAVAGSLSAGPGTRVGQERCFSCFGVFRQQSMLLPKSGNQFHMFVGSFVRCFVESVLISLLGVSHVCWSESQLLDDFDGSNSLLISL